MMAKKISENFLFRNKPFIVICGCTGTGKTKLSIQLAEWLIQSKGKRAEIINADAMQVNKQELSL
jgi:tRNA A37 N6-isopentenylltransferase MiaA